jgi:hypothetical protein
LLLEEKRPINNSRSQQITKADSTSPARVHTPQGSKQITDVTVRGLRAKGFSNRALYNLFGPGAWAVIDTTAMFPAGDGLVQPRSILPSQYKKELQQSDEQNAAPPPKEQSEEQDRNLTDKQEVGGQQKKKGWFSSWRKGGGSSEQQRVPLPERT